MKAVRTLTKKKLTQYNRREMRQIIEIISVNDSVGTIGDFLVSIVVGRGEVKNLFTCK